MGLINVGILNRFIDHPIPPPEEVVVSLNFIEDTSGGTYTYTYIAPYSLSISSVEASNSITYTIEYSGSNYILGTVINQFDELIITVSDYGLLVLNGGRP